MENLVKIMTLECLVGIIGWGIVLWSHISNRRMQSESMALRREEAFQNAKDRITYITVKDAYDKGVEAGRAEKS